MANHRTYNEFHDIENRGTKLAERFRNLHDKRYTDPQFVHSVDSGPYQNNRYNRILNAQKSTQREYTRKQFKTNNPGTKEYRRRVQLTSDYETGRINKDTYNRSWETLQRRESIVYKGRNTEIPKNSRSYIGKKIDKVIRRFDPSYNRKTRTIENILDVQKRGKERIERMTIKRATGGGTYVDAAYDMNMATDVHMLNRTKQFNTAISNATSKVKNNPNIGKQLKNMKLDGVLASKMAKGKWALPVIAGAMVVGSIIGGVASSGGTNRSSDPYGRNRNIR